MVHFCHSRAGLPQLPVIFIICKRASRVFFFQKWSCWVPEKKHSLTNEPCLNYSFKQEWAYIYINCARKKGKHHTFSVLYCIFVMQPLLVEKYILIPLYSLILIYISSGKIIIQAQKTKDASWLNLLHHSFILD